MREGTQGEEKKEFTARIVPTKDGHTIVPIEIGGMVDTAIKLGGEITKVEESTEESTKASNAHVTIEDLNRLEKEVYREEHPNEDEKIIPQEKSNESVSISPYNNL